VLANLNLLPERQESYELDNVFFFLKRRLVLTYHTTTIKISTKLQLFHYQLLDTSSVLLNAGTIENKGWEVQFNATPLKPRSYTLIMAKPIINQTGSASRIGNITKELVKVTT
jgi:hypothetical protein